MKTIKIDLDDKDFEKLKAKKKGRSWREFVLTLLLK